MRATVMVTVSALALALAACSPKQAAAPSPPPPAPASEPAPPLSAASAPGPESPPAAPATPENAPATPAPATPAPAAAAPPFRFSPGDFGRQERRIAALVANAETRDTTGETAGVAAQGQRARERCATRRCVEASYAAEEARLRKWEGSGDIR